MKIVGGDGRSPRAGLHALHLDRHHSVLVLQRALHDDERLADQHPADVASETEARELDLARQTMFEARIGLIDEALRRLERGEYGRCIVCGREIPEARLDLVPETPYCVEDAEREQQSSPR